MPTTMSRKVNSLRQVVRVKELKCPLGQQVRSIVKVHIKITSDYEPPSKEVAVIKEVSKLQNEGCFCQFILFAWWRPIEAEKVRKQRELDHKVDQFEGSVGEREG
jgi:hypothetical protein